MAVAHEYTEAICEQNVQMLDCSPCLELSLTCMNRQTVSERLLRLLAAWSDAPAEACRQQQLIGTMTAESKRNGTINAANREHHTYHEPRWLTNCFEVWCAACTSRSEISRLSLLACGLLGVSFSRAITSCFLTCSSCRPSPRPPNGNFKHRLKMHGA